MRTTRGLITLLLLAACRAAPAPPPPSGPAGKLEGRMGNCPSAVDGAVTTMTTVTGGVALDITSADLGVAREIVARANHHAAAGAPDPAAMPHTGAHGGPGDVGHCPVVHNGTRVTVTEIGGGVRIVMLAEDPSQAPALEAETRKRLQWLDPAAH